jgi:RimJ/RimL family protein N-acetyltransferase
VGYWIGRQFWRRGIASAAVAELLGQVKIRPLYAHVANHNICSKRILEKCGFELLDAGAKVSIFKMK